MADTVEIGGVTFTFKATEFAPGELNLASSVEESLDNLLRAFPFSYAMRKLGYSLTKRSNLWVKDYSGKGRPKTSSYASLADIATANKYEDTLDDALLP